MKFKQQAVFWVVVSIVLTFLFSRSLGDFILALYFVTMLFPVVFGTSFFFNHVLVPRYFLQGSKGRFFLYLIYMLIVSVYLELLVMIMAFVILADYHVANLGKITGDIYILTIILYLVVLANGFIEVLRGLKKREKLLSEIKLKKQQEKEEFWVLKVNRRKVRVELKAITYIESMSDYIKVHTPEQTYVTRDKIGTLENTLPDVFLRIHRSFIINTMLITHFSKEEITVAGRRLPVGRKYKPEVTARLETGSGSDS